MTAINLAGFEAKFADNADPWSTWHDPDEILKRRAIMHALSSPIGRMLELGAGNGSNSQMLAKRALRLDATEATDTGTELVRRALVGSEPRARALKLVVPAEPPGVIYDAIVIAELLYYLEPRAMCTLARQVTRRLRPGGTLVLAHHRITYYDFVQRAEGIHKRFLRGTLKTWRVRPVRRTSKWEVIACRA